MVGENGIIGRIGGDEFAQCFPEMLENGQRIRRLIQKKSAAFNENSDKAYYVELSVGYTIVTCSSGLAISDELKDADKALYEEKKKRRKSVKKQLDLEK